jgi:hypothetical protein
MLESGVFVIKVDEISMSLQRSRWLGCLRNMLRFMVESSPAREGFRGA